MKLARALKEKNRLVGEINRLKGLIQRDNSHESTKIVKTDLDKAWADLDTATEKLVNLKAAIFAANVKIEAKIIKIGELKSRVAWLKTLNVQEGTEETPSFRGESIKKEFVANKGQTAVDEMLVKLGAEIDSIQDEIDEFNATMEVVI